MNYEDIIWNGDMETKELKPLKDIVMFLISKDNKGVYRGDIEIIYNALKALDVIKEHFWIEDFQDFIAINGRLKKTSKEKYDLLKEVLK